MAIIDRFQSKLDNFIVRLHGKREIIDLIIDRLSRDLWITLLCDTTSTW